MGQDDAPDVISGCAAAASQSGDASSRSSRDPRSPRVRRTAGFLRGLAQGSLKDDELQDNVSDLFFESVPFENVAELSVEALCNEQSQDRFAQSVQNDGVNWSRVRVTWHA